ncbi:MAG: aminotransferase class V-fold PLP-dependent enzyme [Phototrophicaceae bacterium]
MHTVEIKVPDNLLPKLQETMHSVDKMSDSAKEAFQAKYAGYQKTSAIDALRASDYARLDTLGHTYLDYTGGGLYAESQVKTHMTQLTDNVYGNPHSLNPTSLAATDVTESARRYVLSYLNADPDEYIIIFTANASGALKLIGEAYPFKDNGQYLLTYDNHNSVNGIREYARCCASKITYTAIDPETLRLDADELHANLDNAIPDGNNLFAFPAQSNFSGVQHDLSWIDTAQNKGWDVVLDAAAFLPTNRLDLSQVKPEFVVLSFYKMFGYPTGLGALIMKRDVISKMQRPWFAGGTISVASVQGDSHFLHTNEAGFEDGTINYLSIPAVEIGLRHIDTIGIDTIHERVMVLTEYLLEELTQLKHANGQAVVHIYGDANTDMHGGTLALNFYDADGTVFDYRIVENLANEMKISLRTGCFCNPGAGEVAHHIDGNRLSECFRESESLSFQQLAGNLLNTGDTDVVGAVRISVGIASNFEDVYRFVEFAKIFTDEHSDGIQM